MINISGYLNIRQSLNFLVLIGTITCANFGFAEKTLPDDLLNLLDKVAVVNLKDLEEQEEAHEANLAAAQAYLKQHESNAEAWMATAITRASYARTQGMGAIGEMKKVRKEIEQAIELDSKVLDGYAHSFLGRLYFMLPAWPISYGSDKKAKIYIEESLRINDQTKENQFAYANFLSHQKQYQQAKQHFLKAKNSTSVINTPNWVANLDKQIDEFLVYLDEKIK